MSRLLPRVLHAARVLFILLTCVAHVNAKVFERCELARTLHNKHQLALEEVAIWTCIAQHASNFNTDAYAGGRNGGSHGLFQISDVFWCTTSSKHGECDISCESLRDADLSDDLNCARTIYNEHKHLSGNGYKAWTTYDQYCSHDVAHYIQDCFPSYWRSVASNPWLAAKSNTWLSAAANAVTLDKSNPWLRASSKQLSAHASADTLSTTPSATASASAQATAASYTPPAAKSHFSTFSSSYSIQQRGKIYDRCELAQELYNKHKMPMEQVPTWVCIAQHESNFDTSAVGRRNADGSADHGLFQISDLYWCGHDHYSGGKACSMECTKLLDNDISDDVRCIKRIHNEHTGITGDGFMAWSVYDQYCRDQQYDYIAACFKEQAYEETAETTISNITTLAIPTPHKYHANPYLKYVSVPVNLTHTTPHQQQHSYTTTHNQTVKGKIYKRCELAQELLFKHKFPMQDIATWVCIAQYESNFNTAAVGHLSGGGSADHGLFQISDLYWCAHDTLGGKACNISCALLLDDDLSDDVECARRIHEEHTRLSGDGFTAWTVYNGRCRNQEYAQIADCFDSSNEISKTHTFSTSTQVADKHKNIGGLALAQGKIYGECELAQELYYKHSLPLKDISAWVCIAEHVSSFKTAAVGHRNADGSADHGLFQISDLYWCAHDERDKGCKIPCDKLLDTDISDDLECAQTIYAEHARISGDGFTAWRVYKRNCSSAHLARVSHCFPADVLNKAQADADKSNNSVQKSSSAEGKIYKKCELAQELYFKHKVPMKDVRTWVCIAEHGSRFNTAAVGRANADGSADHGLLQISDLYWCAHAREGGKACRISCDKLLDNDITDDVRCAKIIFDEHTRLTGDGFTAWTVYERECRDQDLEQLSSCFDSKEWESAKQESGVRQSEKIDRLNAITNLTYKEMKHKGELSHPFVNNPFLNQFRAMKIVPFIPVQITTTTERPIIQYTSKTYFLDNPFLSALIRPHHSTKPNVYITSDSPISTHKLKYASNPFLNNNANKKMQASLQQPKPVYERQKETEISAQYKNNPFLHNFVATQQSTVSKASVQPKPKTRTTPGSTSKTKTRIGPSKLYVNSEVFRTTPVKTRVTLDQLNLIPEANTHAIVFKKPYVNSEMFRTTPVSAQTSSAQMSTSPETLRTSTFSSETTNNFITPLTTDNVGPSRNVFSNNPFLSKFMQSPHTSAGITTTTKTHINTKSSEPSNASYSFNLLNKSSANEIEVQTSAPQTQNKQKQNYKFNPFLNNFIVQTSSLTGTTTNKNKITTISVPLPQKNTQAQYQFNPFLQKFSASALNAATNVSAQKEQAHTTPSSFTELQTAFTSPPISSELFSTTAMRTPATSEGFDVTHQTQKLMTAETPQYSSKTAFLHNPFLNKFVQFHNSNAAIKTKPHFNAEPAKPSSAPYLSNPFLNKPSQSDSKIETFTPHIQNIQQQNYQSNPFLNKYISQLSTSTFITPAKLKTKTTAEPQVLYSSFLQNFSASSKASSQQNQKTLTTPSSTKKTTANIGLSKPYVNSEMFRTRPVKTQTTFQPEKPVLETQKLYNSFSKPYINAAMFRTTPGKMQASLEQPTPIYERQKPSTEKSVTFTTSNKLLASTVSTTTTQKPRTQTTKQYINTTTTPMKPASYDRTQELNRQNPSQTQPAKSPITEISIYSTKTQVPVEKNKTNVGTTTVRTTKFAGTQRSKTVINSAFKTITAYTTRKPMNLTTADISQQKQASLSTTALGSSTRDLNIRQKPRATTSRPNTNLSGSKTTARNIKNTAETTTKRTKLTRKPITTVRISPTQKTTTQPKTKPTKTVKPQYNSKTAARIPTTRSKASITQKTAVVNKTTTRPTTAYQKATTQLTTKTLQKEYASKTTTRKPTNTAKASPTENTTVVIKTTTRPTTAYQKATTQSTTKMLQKEDAYKTTIKIPTTTSQMPITQKPTVINKTTTRPTTSYQKATSQSTTKTLRKQYASETTTSKPITPTRTSITQKTTITTKPATRPATTTQKSTAKAQLQHSDSTSTRRPTTTVRTPTTARTTHHSSIVRQNYLSSTTNVPYNTAKQDFTNSFNKYNKKTQATTTTIRPFKGTPITPRTTTRKSASSETFQNKTKATTKTTVPSKTTTSNPYRNDPFSHPFFAKFNQKFKENTSTTKGTTIKPTTSNTKYRSQTQVGGESEYYQQFKNHTAGNVKTTYAYAFGKNSTLALNKGR